MNSKVMINNEITNNHSTNLVDNATNTIRDKIFTHEFPGDTIITEVKLAEELKVSRGVIRSSLKELQTQGLVMAMPNGRKRVIGFTLKYITDLYDVRKTLETKAIEGILQNDNIRMNFLSKAIQIVDLINDDRFKSPEKHAELDYLFHKTIVEESGNYIVMQCWNTIAPLLITLFKINTSREKNHAKYYDIHTAIVEKIVRHDDEAIQLISQHFDESRNMIINTLKNLNYI